MVTVVPVPLATTPVPGLNTTHPRLARTGPGGGADLLVGQPATGTLLMLIDAVSCPVLRTVTVGEPVTVGLVYAKAGWLTMAFAPSTVAPPTASRPSAERRSMVADYPSGAQSCIDRELPRRPASRGRSRRRPAATSQMRLPVWDSV